MPALIRHFLSWIKSLGRHLFHVKDTPLKEEPVHVRGLRRDITALRRVDDRAATRILRGLILKLNQENVGDIDLSQCHLDGADLRKVNLHGACLEKSVFKNAVLLEADLNEAQMAGCDLARADLEGARLAGARLHQADLSGAYLKFVDFAETDLTGATLAGAILTHARNLRADQLLAVRTLHRADLDPDLLKAVRRLRPNLFLPPDGQNSQTSCKKQPETAACLHSAGQLANSTG